MKNAHICSRKYIFLGCVFIVVAVIILVVLQQGVEAESEIIYHLPDEKEDSYRWLEAVEKAKTELILAGKNVIIAEEFGKLYEVS